MGSGSCRAWLPASRSSWRCRRRLLSGAASLSASPLTAAQVRAARQLLLLYWMWLLLHTATAPLPAPLCRLPAWAPAKRPGKESGDNKALLAWGGDAWAAVLGANGLEHSQHHLQGNLHMCVGAGEGAAVLGLAGQEAAPWRLWCLWNTCPVPGLSGSAGLPSGVRGSSCSPRASAALIPQTRRPRGCAPRERHSCGARQAAPQKLGAWGLGRHRRR